MVDGSIVPMGSLLTRSFHIQALGLNLERGGALADEFRLELSVILPGAEGGYSSRSHGCFT